MPQGKVMQYPILKEMELEFTDRHRRPNSSWFWKAFVSAQVGARGIDRASACKLLSELTISSLQSCATPGPRPCRSSCAESIGWKKSPA